MSEEIAQTTTPIETPNANALHKMPTPQAKRRRLNEASKTLHKPFKSPFRTPLRSNTSSEPPSSDPPEVHSFCSVRTPASVPNANTAATPTNPDLPKTGKPRPLSTPTRIAPKKGSSGLTREIIQLRSDIQVLTQAQALATSTKDEDLERLVETWRTASRAAAEEVFAGTRDRVNRMGGVAAWRERERDQKERQRKWDREEMDAERERFEDQRKEAGATCEYEDYADVGGQEKVEVEDEIRVNDDESFTMDMMLKTLNIDVALIGYNREFQRWEG